MKASTNRVALYARVSTTRQAEADLSIPDQIRQAEAFCQQKGWDIVEHYIEPGASATDDRRPEFQRMIEAATAHECPFDVVLVHSMSRFFRDQFQSEFYIRKLRRARVLVVSMTQQFENDPTGDLVRKILGNFDEYQSQENAKHTLRAMRENARQDFWNGSIPPFGYRPEAVGRRGERIKKRLAIDETEAAVVRRIFDLALGRAGPPRGVKAIVSMFNAEGITFRGKPFHISNVHRILTSPTYAGTHYFDRRCSRSGGIKAREEWVAARVPAIIDSEAWTIVQSSLASRNPRRTPPRLVSGPTLLTGLAQCGHCGSGMTIRTGKGGRYRYYACAGRAQKGATRCVGQSISMAALDGMVLEHLADRLFTPERLATLLDAYVARSAEADAERRRKLGQARQRVTEIGGKIARLMQLTANGAMDPDDPALADMLAGLKAQRAAAQDEVKLLESSRTGSSSITPDKIARFTEALRTALHDDDPAFRKAYLRLFVDAVIVGQGELRIHGPISALAKGAGLGDLPPSGEMVPSFVRGWRPRRDSNPRPQD